MPQPIPKFSTTLNGHPVFIPVMVWHVPDEFLLPAIEVLRTIDEKSFVECGGVCKAVDYALQHHIEHFPTVYNWVGNAVCYFDHTKKLVEETWLEQYFQHRFGLCGKHRASSDVVHYTHEQITALRLAWLEHIATHLEAAVK